MVAAAKSVAQAAVAVQQTHARHILIKVTPTMSAYDAKRKLGELKERLGVALLPVLIAAGNALVRLADFAAPFVDKLGEFVEKGVAAAFEALGKAWEFAAPWAEKIFGFLN